jgi:hypothetical protein
MHCLAITATVPPTRNVISLFRILVTPYGGYNNTDIGGDPTYRMRTLAFQVNSGSHSLMMDEMIAFGFTNFKLIHKPGAIFDSLKLRYVMFVRIAEKVIGKDYFTLLKKSIIDLSAVDLQNDAYVAYVYGGNGMLLAGVGRYVSVCWLALIRLANIITNYISST